MILLVGIELKDTRDFACVHSPRSISCQWVLTSIWIGAVPAKVDSLSGIGYMCFLQVGRPSDVDSAHSCQLENNLGLVSAAVASAAAAGWVWRPAVAVLGVLYTQAGLLKHMTPVCSPCVEIMQHLY